MGGIIFVPILYTETLQIVGTSPKIDLKNKGRNLHTSDFPDYVRHLKKQKGGGIHYI